MGQRARSGAERANNAGPNDGDAVAPKRDGAALLVRGSAPDQLYRVATAAIRRVLGPGHAETDDVVQTAVERVVRGLQGGRFSGLCSLPTWVTTVARHTALDERRSPRCSLQLEVSAESVPTAVDLDGQLDARSMLGRVAAVLASMDPLTAEIMMMHDIVGHSLAEIAELKQISIAAVQSRLVRGRKVLFAQLAAARESS